MIRKLNRLFRKVHFWGALVVLLPVLIVIGSGLLLQVKKQVEWVQPASVKGSQYDPEISIQQLLNAVYDAEQSIQDQSQIKRIDIRLDKNIAKVQTEQGLEFQLDLANAQVLKTAQRRSDIIESIHDGSWFFPGANLWLFLPSAILLLLIWMTGSYMLVITLLNKRKSRLKRKLKQS